jgi:tetratricopeptide (TPR) repeat protein
MGDEVFFRMLKEFARRYKNAHATFIDFVSLCNEVSRRDWMPFFYQWCYGKGCPAYHLVGFKSEEGKEGWETTVKIRNDGQGIVRCPLELRMEKAGREEVFWVRGGEESTFFYKTKKKVTDVVIDPEETAYQADLAARRKDPAYLVRSLGWGRKSNREIASKYGREWLDQITDPGLLLKTGFALYDVKRYDEALAVFEKMEEKAGGQRTTKAIAVIWQGHMLDLLKKRQEAISRYEKVAAMETKREIYQRHDQFGLAYYPSPYARERINTPFTRVENRSDD